MNNQLVADKVDWKTLLDRMQSSEERHLPTYPGDLKMALLNHVGLVGDSRGEDAYQLAVEIARLTTCCDPEVVYWFSRLVALIQPRA